MFDIIIINYNCANHIQRLLESLFHTESATLTRHNRFTVTVVDNRSTDGSANLIEAQFPMVNLIAREENDGYAAAVNEGIASTHQREILLLNSDVLITPSQAATLYRVWQRLDFPGIVAPLHFEDDGFPQLTWGRFPTYTEEKRRQKLDFALADRESWARKTVLAEACKTREVDWVSGSCMFFARSTAFDIGPWDQNFFLYFEDIDWCLRAKEKGYSIYHTSEVQVRHAHGASVAKDPELAEIEYRRSQCYFTKKYFGGFTLFKLRWYLTLKMMGRWFIGRRSGFSRGLSWEVFREVWSKPGI